MIRPDGNAAAVQRPPTGRLAILRRSLRKSRPALIAALPALFALLAIGLFVAVCRVAATNRTIARLRSNHDVQVAAGALPEASLARIQFLLSRGRVDEAEPLVAALDRSASDPVRADAHYNLANARLRQAFEQLTRDKLDAAGPFVVLAREEYRRALTLRPDDWDARFNLDVASRLIRDFPAFERTTGDTVESDRRKIWTDLPGTLKGLP